MKTKSNLIKLMAVTILIFSGLNHADPISIFGLNISMNEDQIKNQLIKRGFSCHKYSSRNMICGKSSNPSVMTEMQEAFLERGASISAQDNQVLVTWGQQDTVQSIEIGCDVIGTCTYLLRQSAQKLVDSVNVNTLESRPKQTIIGRSISRYCGFGVDGDLVCIEEAFLSPGNTGTVYIYKENFGKPKPSFN